MRDLRRQALPRLGQHADLGVAQRTGNADLGFCRIRRSVSATRKAATWSFTDQWVTSNERAPA